MKSPVSGIGYFQQASEVPRSILHLLCWNLLGLAPKSGVLFPLRSRPLQSELVNDLPAGGKTQFPRFSTPRLFPTAYAIQAHWGPHFWDLPQISVYFWHSGPSHTSVNRLQLFRGRPQQSEEQRTP